MGYRIRREGDAYEDYIEDGRELTVGQMAELNCVSEKMLRLYQEKGLLVPSRVDERTGYRYYALEQSTALNNIVRLRNIGFGLDDIKRILSERFAIELTDLYQDRLEQIEQEMDALRIARSRVREYLAERCTTVAKYRLNTVALEWQPAKRVVYFDAIPGPGIDLQGTDRTKNAAQWYRALGLVKRELQERGLPPILFNEASSVVTADSLAARSIKVTRICIAIEDSLALDYPDAETIPAGHSLVYHTDDYFRAPATFEGDTILAMLDYADEHGYRVRGDYLGAGSIDEPIEVVDGSAAIMKFAIPVTID